MARPRHASHCFRALLAVLLAALSCGKEAVQNPASLWLSYSQSEINLVLIDHEPPPF